ncbi:hypothetical protein KX729_09330 [Rhizobium sp. XQZ8]|uniref:hypothetical protein n=1 Tax=Rhizobium populisoli TaxID=2859785 RepID=UPI001CA562F0|nr:hypothetical protein [Rhizobium populisoli]MBW6421641.1 hypothetical protein [Rhizobium populisoli]
MKDNTKLVADINSAIQSLDKAITAYHAVMMPQPYGSTEPMSLTFYPMDLLTNLKHAVREVVSKRISADETARILNLGLKKESK